MRLFPAAALAASLAGLTPAAGAAAVPSTPPAGLSFTILKDGEPIGHETYAFSRTGDALTVRVHTETRARVLFLDFHFRHDRTETWRGDRVARLSSNTDDDGTLHHVEAIDAGDGPRLTADGESRTLPRGTLPLSLWGEAILSRGLLYGIVDGRSYRVAVQDLGRETLTIADHPQPAEHFRLSGDIERDLWFGNDGLLLQAAFERMGYPIRFVRDPAPTTGAAP